MINRITRREFLKVTGLGTIASALSISAPGKLHPDADPLWMDSPGFERDTKNSPIPTTCNLCSAGCGILTYVGNGRNHEISGNPVHPLNYGQLCSLAQESLGAGGLVSSLPGPLSRTGPGSSFSSINWDVAVDAIANVLKQYRPSQIAFLVGLFPDHLYDLLRRLLSGMSGMSLLRYSPRSEFEARVTLMDAVQKAFGVSSIPYFDLANADVIFSFGANFLENWLSPAAFTHRFNLALNSAGGYLVQFEPRQSATAALADEWIPIIPGSEVHLARALASLVSNKERLDGSGSVSKVDLTNVAALTGVSVDQIKRLAALFSQASRKVALPGSSPLGGTDGLAAASAILGLNIQSRNLGRPGGVYLLPDVPVHADLIDRPSTIAEVGALIERIRSGRIKVLFVHAADPLTEIPDSMGLREALEQLDILVSFSPYWNETASAAHYILPDQVPLASWGYQKVHTGTDRLVISALQPVILPVEGALSSVDVMLQATRRAGGKLAESLPYEDEVAFIKASIQGLRTQGGVYTANDLEGFWKRWLEHGGWWTANPGIMPPVPLKIGIQIDCDQEALLEQHNHGNQLPLLTYIATTQERLLSGLRLGEPLKAALHPVTAREQGVKDGDLVMIRSSASEIQACIHVTDTVIPGSLALPLMDLHNQNGDRKLTTNPWNLLLMEENQSGNLAASATVVKITRVAL